MCCVLMTPLTFNSKYTRKAIQAVRLCTKLQSP